MGNKRYISSEQRKKLFLFTNEIIFYIKNSKELAKTIMELNDYSKFAGYKVNIQKETALLYSSNEQMNLKWKLNMHIPSKPKNTFLIFPREMKAYFPTKYYTQMLATALLTGQTELKCPSRSECINKFWSIHEMKSHSAIKTTAW